ncbi:hypothetical protein [Halorubrum ezzemoulense]|nr:hypothetical protein [Halorubrum ezzemoulense]
MELIEGLYRRPRRLPRGLTPGCVHEPGTREFVIPESELSRLRDR